MKVQIIRGPKTEENIRKCLEYLVFKYRKEILRSLEQSNSRSLSSIERLDYNKKNSKETEGER